MRQLVCFTVVLCLALVSPVWGDAPTKKSPAPPTVEQLIQQLSGRDKKARESARQALVALDASAIPALQRARAHVDPESRRVLDELIPALERTAVLTPKRVSIHMTNKSANAVLAEVAKQTGYKIDSANTGAGQTLYTFHLDKLTFWEAMDKICEATGMVLLPYYYWGGGDESLHFQAQESYVPYNYVRGPFKVMANSFSYQRNNNFSQLPKNAGQPAQTGYESLNLGLTLAVEPKIPLIKMGQVRLLAAEDDENHSMVPPVDPNQRGYGRMYWGWWGGSGKMFVMQTSANLLWPSKTAKSVKLLKGVIPVTLLSEQRPTVVTERILASKGKRVKIGPTTFHIQEVSEVANKQYNLTVAISEETKENIYDYSRIQSLGTRLEIHDNKGNKLPYFFNITQFNGPMSGVFQAVYQPNPQPNAAKFGPPAKLVYTAWILMEHDVEFEFRDLPLP
jgi:hypothetical protein